MREWVVLVERWISPAKEIAVLASDSEEALRKAQQSAKEVWGIWDAKAFNTPKLKV